MLIVRSFLAIRPAVATIHFFLQVDITNTLNSLSSLAQHYTALLEDINNEIESTSLVSSSGPFDQLPVSIFIWVTIIYFFLLLISCIT